MTRQQQAYIAFSESHVEHICKGDSIALSLRKTVARTFVTKSKNKKVLEQPNLQNMTGRNISKPINKPSRILHNSRKKMYRELHQSTSNKWN
ncbi:hypothetical protein O181_122017 [Austropuccinia psidii MF-1]|uniref:Uncharacterized protein n=1 Tax=Austropuccinia psidii MF-1 TaxID=1389203 RepID=A0A9Q3KM90_9BASI|nr:hypothetical protein [Austropuccinia psidii MF-1]